MIASKQISMLGAQIENINADTDKKRAEAGTETYKQTELSARADDLIASKALKKEQKSQVQITREIQVIEKEILNATKHIQKAKPYIDIAERLIRAGVSIFVVRKLLTSGGLKLLKSKGSDILKADPRAYEKFKEMGRNFKI